MSISGGNFLAIMEITIFQMIQKPTGLQPECNIISRSKPKCPPHTMQPPIFSTIFLIFSGSEYYRGQYLIVSAVPAGVVMALDEFLGILYPAAATIGTRIMSYLVPAKPPVECLSATIPLNLSFIPVSGHGFGKEYNSS